MTDDDIEKQKLYHFARYCWRNRDELAPNIEAGSRWTWADIFKRRHKISLDEYVKQRQAESRSARNG